MDKYIDNYNDSKKVTYHEQTDISNILKLRAVLKTLPDFCKDYFRAMDPLTTTKTRISYAYDIRIFFQFLLDENPAFKDYSMKDFTVDVLDQLKAIDIEEYQEYLKVYKNGDKGNEYLSIVYADNSDKQKNFYPDYIISVNGEVWIVETKGGFARTKWCGKLECELKMKELAGVSSRCMPLKQSGTEGVCPVCGEKCTTDIYWGVAY